MEEVVAVGEFLDMEAEEIEHLDEEEFELALFVHAANLVEQIVDSGRRLGAELEQAILAACEFGLKFLVSGSGFFDECVEAFFGETIGEFSDILGEGRLDFGSAVDGCFESVEALMIPEGEGLGAGAGEDRQVDVDGGSLTDAIKAADALL